MDRNIFRKTVADFILDAVPKSLIYNLDNFSIRMKKGEYWIDLALENFYRGYCRQKPALRNTYMAEVLEPFIKDLSRECGVNHQDVKKNINKLYPLIVGSRDAKGLVTTSLTEDFSIAYVLDQGMRIFFLDQPTMDNLDIPVEKINVIALNNFSRDLFKPLQLFDEDRKVYGFNYGDSYDSSRLLSLVYWPEKHGLSPKRQVYIMVPNRDVVLMLYSKEESILRQSVMIGRSSFLNNPYPVSGKVYQLKNGIIEQYLNL